MSSPPAYQTFYEMTEGEWWIIHAVGRETSRGVGCPAPHCPPRTAAGGMNYAGKVPALSASVGGLRTAARLPRGGAGAGERCCSPPTPSRPPARGPHTFQFAACGATLQRSDWKGRNGFSETQRGILGIFAEGCTDWNPLIRTHGHFWVSHKSTWC